MSPIGKEQSPIDFYQPTCSKRRPSILYSIVTALIVGTGCALLLLEEPDCLDPKARAITESMTNHSDQWYYDGSYFRNATKNVHIWGNDIYLKSNEFSTSACRAMMGKAADNVKVRSRDDLGLLIVERLN